MVNWIEQVCECAVAPPPPTGLTAGTPGREDGDDLRALVRMRTELSAQLRQADALLATRIVARLRERLGDEAECDPS